MANSSANLAVTKDGGAYNILRRPDDYLMGATAPLPPPLPAVRKRKWGHDIAPGVKRPRPENKNHDDNIGLRTILPTFEEEDSSGESTSEALAYLQSVMSEASAIPSTLVAPKTSNVNHNNNDDDASPYTHDSGTHGPGFKDGVFGVWRSADDVYNAEDNEEDWDEDQEAQETCYAQLLKRFHALRAKMLQSPSTSEHARRPRIPTNREAWLDTIERETPKLQQLRHIAERDVYFGIQACSASLAYSDGISREKSCWIWGLLAVAGDVGTLSNELVAKIRHLGMQANRLRLRLRDQDQRRQISGGREAGVVDSEAKYEGSGAKECDNASVESGELVEEDELEHQRQAVPDSLLIELEPMDDLHTGGADGNASVESGELAVGQEQVQGIEAVPDHPVEPETVDDVQTVDANGNASSSDAEMDMSEDEDEAQQITENKKLEEARARLLAQLGDRLVQTQIPKVPASRAEAEWLRSQKLKQQQAKTEINNGTSQTRTEEKVSRGVETDSKDPTEAEWNTKMTIDMILTVVAECYGQRDLLEFREAW